MAQYHTYKATYCRWHSIIHTKTIKVAEVIISEDSCLWLTVRVLCAFLGFIIDAITPYTYSWSQPHVVSYTLLRIWNIEKEIMSYSSFGFARVRITAILISEGPLYWYTPREGLDTAKLSIGVARNDVTKYIKGGVTCNNSKQWLQTSSLVIKLSII